MGDADKNGHDPLPPNPACAGVWTIEPERKPPGCCEIHMLPWGHDRAKLGWLEGMVRPDERR